MYTLHVTNLQDSGAGSLRQAILDANAHTGSEPIEIIFDAALDGGSVALESELPTLTAAGVTIGGPAHGSVSLENYGLSSNSSFVLKNITLPSLSLGTAAKNVSGSHVVLTGNGAVISMSGYTDLSALEAVSTQEESWVALSEYSSGVEQLNLCALGNGSNALNRYHVDAWQYGTNLLVGSGVEVQLESALEFVNITLEQGAHLYTHSVWDDVLLYCNGGVISAADALVEVGMELVYDYQTQKAGMIEAGSKLHCTHDVHVNGAAGDFAEGAEHTLDKDAVLVYSIDDLTNTIAGDISYLTQEKLDMFPSYGGKLCLGVYWMEADGDDALTIAAGVTAPVDVSTYNGGTLVAEKGSTVQGVIDVGGAGKIVSEDATFAGKMYVNTWGGLFVTAGASGLCAPASFVGILRPRNLRGAG